MLSSHISSYLAYYAGIRIRSLSFMVPFDADTYGECSLSLEPTNPFGTELATKTGVYQVRFWKIRDTVRLSMNFTLSGVLTWGSCSTTSRVSLGWPMAESKTKSTAHSFLVWGEQTVYWSYSRI